MFYEAVNRCAHVLNPLKLAHLRQLRRKLRVVHWVQGILVLHLRNQHLHEVILNLLGGIADIRVGGFNLVGRCRVIAPD